jgi:hypothetical protein
MISRIEQARRGVQLPQRHNKTCRAMSESGAAGHTAENHEL